jgi:hypothetical protein
MQPPTRDKRLNDGGNKLDMLDTGSPCNRVARQSCCHKRTAMEPIHYTKAVEDL